jgi:hypothetical protein
VDGTPVLPPSGGDQLQRLQTWQTNNYPAIMRLGFLQTSPGAVLINNLDTTARTVFLAPATAGVTTTANINTIDPRTAATPTPSLSPVNITCNLASTYVCSARVVVGLTTPAIQRYLKITSIYDTANFRIRLLNSAGAVVQMNGVQPIVDSTGVANDVFRRVQARIQLGSRGFYTDYAVESSEHFCKDFFVTFDSYTSNAPASCP